MGCRPKVSVRAWTLAMSALPPFSPRAANGRFRFVTTASGKLRCAAARRLLLGHDLDDRTCRGCIGPVRPQSRRLGGLQAAPSLMIPAPYGRTLAPRDHQKLIPFDEDQFKASVVQVLAF